MPIIYSTGGERLTGVFQTLQNWGFQDFLLPFLLFFALVFAILQKVKLFVSTKTVQGGQPTVVPDRKLNGLISAAISAMIVVPHVLRLYPSNTDPIELLAQFLPLSTIAFIVVVFGLLFVGMVSKQEDFEKPSAMRAIVGLVAAAIVLISFLKSIAPSLLPEWLTFSSSTTTTAIVVSVMLLVVYFITAEPSTEPAAKSLRKIFGGTE